LLHVSITLLSLFSFSPSLPHPHPHPFPTRRSSDLRTRSGGAASIYGSIIRRSRRRRASSRARCRGSTPGWRARSRSSWRRCGRRSEEHTSELQSRVDLVCRLLLEKKKNIAERRKKY